MDIRKGTPLLLAELSWPEVKAALPDIELVLIPVGALEQHGPHGALATDTVSADALCQAAAARLGPRVAVAPPVPWGVSWHHMAFPGTVSLRPETLIAVLEDIVGSLHAHGLARFLIVNGHGGNTAAITLAVERLKQALGIPVVAAIFGYALIAEAAGRVLPPDAIGHAGADEMAVVAAAAPRLAKPAAQTRPDLIGTQAETAVLLRGYGGTLARPYHEVTRNGATADATPATPALGREILADAAARLAEVITVLLRESGQAA